MVHKTKKYVGKSEATVSIAVEHPFVIVKFQEKKAGDSDTMGVKEVCGWTPAF